MLSLIKFSECCLISYVLIVSVVCAVEWESAPGCPKGNPSNGELYLKHQRDGKCYKVNSRGPCGRNMIFIPYPNIVLSSNTNPNYARSDSNSRRPSTTFGFCDCFDAVKETEEELDFIKDYTTDCMADKRTQIYVSERRRCYSAFHQGPCTAGNFLILNSTFHPMCTKNVCNDRSSQLSVNPRIPKNSELSPRFMFTLSKRGPCFETKSQGYCPKHHILRMTRNHWLPTCSYIRQDRGNNKCPIRNEIFTNEIPISTCKPGSRIDFLTGCSQSINPR